ncbi:MAG: hypothetical protein J2P36_19300, partial [Ktedonobacteraceae bacterium]|nr:hypothetical protein [Ktedonobacteraceae bacterium]
RHRFSYLFLGGERQAVLDALHPYQNPDGGFGNALEPDLRGPLSQPIPGWTALCILDEINAFDNHLVHQVCTYLTTITTAEGGVPFVLPSANAYPRAPWWQSPDHPSAALNPTAAIAGLLHKHRVDHPWLARATAYCWDHISTLETTSPYEMRAILPFLDEVPERERAEQAFAHVGPKILEQRLVTLDPAASGEMEVHTPLNFAPHPDSLARKLFTDEIIDAHLDALVAAQQEDGGWTFNWPTWTPAIEPEWRGSITIEALKTLRAYNRL